MIAFQTSDVAETVEDADHFSEVTLEKLRDNQICSVTDLHDVYCDENEYLYGSLITQCLIKSDVPKDQRKAMKERITKQLNQSIQG